MSTYVALIPHPSQQESFMSSYGGMNGSGSQQAAMGWFTEGLHGPIIAMASTGSAEMIERHSKRTGC